MQHLYLGGLSQEKTGTIAGRGTAMAAAATAAASLDTSSVVICHNCGKGGHYKSGCAMPGKIHGKGKKPATAGQAKKGWRWSWAKVVRKELHTHRRAAPTQQLCCVSTMTSGLRLISTTILTTKYTQQYVRFRQSATTQASRHELASQMLPRAMYFCFFPLLCVFIFYNINDQFLDFFPRTADIHSCDERPSRPVSYTHLTLPTKA